MARAKQTALILIYNIARSMCFNMLYFRELLTKCFFGLLVVMMMMTMMAVFVNAVALFSIHFGPLLPRLQPLAAFSKRNGMFG